VRTPWLALCGVMLLTAAGCASVSRVERGDVIRAALGSTVQIRSERQGGVRRAASGVVVLTSEQPLRIWVVTTKHLLAPPATQEVFVTVAGVRHPAKIFGVSASVDLALLQVERVRLPAVTIKPEAQLGDDVWIVSYPWGRRRTLISGVVSQVTTEDDVDGYAGTPRMIDASVSYGSSGGGVFDAVTGALLGIVESYRTARMTVAEAPERFIEVPVPGQTTMVSSSAIRDFLRELGLDDPALQ
jgi:serine protease Do